MRARAFVWLVALACIGNARAGEPARPNILFIYADDQPYKTLGCYPEAPAWARTPNIDRLAEEGIRFERCYLGAWCMPSRASLLTGRLQHAIQSMTMAGAYPGSTYDPKQCPFWPAEFRRQGYQTAQIGKWHTGTDTGFGRDWDFQIVWNRPAHPENAGNYYKEQILAFNGEERMVQGYPTDNYTDWAVEYITGKGRDPKKPWYLWLCYGAIHGPTTPAERHRGAMTGKMAPVPPDIFGPWPDKPAYLDATRAWAKAPDGRPAMRRRGGKNKSPSLGKSFDSWVQQVHECTMALDEGVGRVLEALDKSGQAGNTLVVYTADQGYGLGEHGFNQKVAPYDATIASPLIIRQPGVLPRGKLCRHPVNSPDLVDLFCRLAGVSLPWKTHGHDITPLLRDPETVPWDRPVLLTHTGRSYGSDTDTIPTDGRLTDTSGVPWYAMLRHGKYKYVRTLAAGEIEELYDLDADPEELRNLALDREHQDMLEAMRIKAIDELRRTDARFVDSMPPSRAMAERQ